MKRIFAYALLGSVLWASDYDFDMSAIEVKPYTLSGYLKGEAKHQMLNSDSPMYASKNKSSMQSYLGEANLKFAYFKDAWKIDSEFLANYSDVDGDFNKNFTTAQAYAQYKFDTNNLIEIGKKSPKWGKGYFANPVAFFDRKKNPDDPEASREGYMMVNYRYNKSFAGDLQNLTIDLLYLPTSKSLNEDFFAKDTNNFGLKAYFLYLDTDIDFIYFNSDETKDFVGVDFSKNLQTNFEVHGELAYELDGDTVSYLLGLKYLSESEITTTLEYLHQNKELSAKEPLSDNQYLIAKISLSEPFDILYSGVYYKNNYNIQDNSMQHALGATYKFKNDFFTDLSFYTNQGDAKSEYGSKLVADTIWAKLYYYF